MREFNTISSLAAMAPWKVEIIAELYERAAASGSTPEDELMAAACAAARVAQLDGRASHPRS